MLVCFAAVVISAESAKALMFSIILSCAEKDLYRSSIGTVGLYLMLLMHLLESKVAIDLTRSEFTETQEVHSFFFRAGLIYIFNNHLKGFVTNRKILTFFFCHVIICRLCCRWEIGIFAFQPSCLDVMVSLKCLEGSMHILLGVFLRQLFTLLKQQRYFKKKFLCFLQSSYI